MPKITIATWFTLIRIGMVPFLVIAIFNHAWVMACMLLAGAALSDMLDGWCARWLQEETEFGAALDPVADKLLVITSYLTLMSIESTFFAVPFWFTILVIVRELVLVGGAVYLSICQQYVPLRPTLLGKLTTVVQLLFIGILLGVSLLHIRGGYVVEIGFAVALACVIASLIHYIFLGLQGFLACRLKNT